MEVCKNVYRVSVFKAYLLSAVLFRHLLGIKSVFTRYKLAIYSLHWIEEIATK
jgi:hypothetical protein